jgi:hypothetical protein
MATVLTFWCLPEEEADFLDYLCKWEIYAYPPDAFPSIAEVKPRPIQILIKEQNPSQFDFGPKQFLSKNDIGDRRLLDGGHAYGSSLMQGHTIGYRRPYRRIGGGLGQCNLAAYWKYPNAEATGFIEKNPEFIKWAKKVFSWGRKWTSERVMLDGYAYPATKKVKQLVEQNKLTVGV